MFNNSKENVIADTKNTYRGYLRTEVNTKLRGSTVLYREMNFASDSRG